MAAFLLQHQSWVVGTETLRPTRPKIFTICPFTEKSVQTSGFDEWVRLWAKYYTCYSNVCFTYRNCLFWVLTNVSKIEYKTGQDSLNVHISMCILYVPVVKVLYDLVTVDIYVNSVFATYFKDSWLLWSRDLLRFYSYLWAICLVFTSTTDTPVDNCLCWGINTKLTVLFGFCDLKKICLS